jgi:hypothetical protein
LLPLLLVLLLYDRAAMFDQTIAFRGDLRAAIPGSWAETWAEFSLMLQTHWGLWLLAGGGVISAALGRIEGGLPVNPLAYPLLWIVWLGAGLAMLAWHTPLFTHHLVVLFPPLILLGSGLVAEVVVWWRQRSWLALLFSAGLVAALFNLPAMIAANQSQATIVTGGREAEAINFLQAVTGPSDFVMGDSQLLIYMAGRRTPPPLGDVALVAIKAGLQTSARMIGLSEDYHAAAVTQWSLRLPWLPDYLTWVETHYLARRVWDNDHIIYFVPRLSANQVPHSQASPLGKALVLRGYDLDPGSFKAGQPLTLRLYWQAEVSLGEDYTMFTQVLNGDGVLVAGWDSQPLAGHFPTSQWPAGEIVTDRLQVPLPADLPAGDYTIITGVYLLETLERLTTPSGVDHLTLMTLPLTLEH